MPLANGSGWPKRQKQRVGPDRDPQHCLKCLNDLAINVTFRTWKMPQKEKEKRPIFQVRNCSGGGAVWLLLSRHITDIEDFRQDSLARISRATTVGNLF